MDKYTNIQEEYTILLHGLGIKQIQLRLGGYNNAWIRYDSYAINTYEKTTACDPYTITSNDSSTYPMDGEQDGVWYVAQFTTE